ncbi:LAMI_0H14070g1_1 [Lachancea mirantina]|uniref:LAMI_0H14070g1_1 n=1 Tax=Lachancea mirantina TaxID=1230905 RepID=A0A1G4KI57_9SACH|nr:LAMI_0H14070g1_1 [Lachancea mirantina]
MSIYSQANFNSQNYQLNRPTYPESLYEAVINFHGTASREVCVDVGCGTGIATFPLLNYFAKVIGTDPSATMLATAGQLKQNLQVDLQDRTEFLQSSAENVSDVCNDSSVDLITGAECIHWVDHPKFFDAAFKALKPGGTLAYWFYVEPIFLDYPKANKIFQKYIHDDPLYLGPLWKFGMKKHLRSFGLTIEIPANKFEDIESHVYIPLESPKETEFMIRKEEYTANDLCSYVQSFSAYHSWQQEHGKDGKDVARMLIDEITKECQWTPDQRLRVEWGTSYFLARKKKNAY